VIANEAIDWDGFVRKAIEYKITPYVALYLRMFCDIFIGVIPSAISNTVLERAKSEQFLWKHIYDKVIELKPPDLILGDYHAYPLINASFEMARLTNKDHKMWTIFYNSTLKKPRKLRQSRCLI
jgi:hypothetical protein